MTDLTERYGTVLEAVAASDGWATTVRASSPPLTLLGVLVQRLSEPDPRDRRVITQLHT
ncbi:MAG: hypothetical protein ACRCXL_05675 [Dermatophilaceae bacterium]